MYYLALPFKKFKKNNKTCQIIIQISVNKSMYYDRDYLPIQGPNPGHKIEDTSDSKAAQNEELLSQQCLLFE